MINLDILNSITTKIQSKKKKFDMNTIIESISVFKSVSNFESLALFHMDKESFMYLPKHVDNISIEDANDYFDYLSELGIVGQAINYDKILIFPELADENYPNNFAVVPISTSLGTDYIVVIKLNEHWKNFKESNLKIIEIQTQLLINAIELSIANEDSKKLKQELEDFKHGQVRDTYESREDINAILNAIQAGVIISNRFTGEILRTNPMADKLIGTSQKDLAGKYISEFLKQENSIANRHYESKLNNTQGEEIEIIRKNTIANIAGVDYLVESFVDITEQKEAQKILLRSKEDLESIVQTRTKDLANTIEQLEDEIKLRQVAETTAENEKKYSELKTKFLLMVSHEFRTPLTVARNNAEILKTYSQRLSIEQIVHHSSRILQTVDYLSTVMSNISNYEQLTNNQITNKSIKIYDLIEERLSHFNKFLNKTIVFSNLVPKEIAVNLSTDVLSPIINNIIDNIITYSKEKVYGKVNYQEDAEHHILRFIDYGIGIPESDLKRVTEIFYRGSNVSNIPGVGMGLAVVKQTLNIINGELAIESEENEWTEVSITLQKTYDNFIQEEKTEAELLKDVSEEIDISDYLENINNDEIVK